MLCELPIAMLACARIGAVHSVVFGGFSADALAQRMEDCKAKVGAGGRGLGGCPGSRVGQGLAGLGSGWGRSAWRAARPRWAGGPGSGAGSKQAEGLPGV